MPFLVRIHGEAPTPDASNDLCFDSPRVVFGRGEGADVRLPDVSVSPRHATIRQRGREFVIVDEGSKNGTRLGTTGVGVRLSPQSPRVLSHGDMIRFGRVFVEFRLDATPSVRPQQHAAKEMAIRLVEQALSKLGEEAGPTVRIEPNGTEVVLNFEKACVVGRARDCDLPLDDSDASRRHVELTRRGGATWIKDLGSKGGFAINGEPQAAQQVEWKVGELLSIGNTRLSLRHEALTVLDELNSAPDTQVEIAEARPGSREVVAEDPEVDDSYSAIEPSTESVDAPRRPASTTRRRSKGLWTHTDFAVMFLALGVAGLSAVGYMVLLR